MFSLFRAQSRRRSRLTWIILILSQLPSLRDQIRNELKSVLGSGRIPTAGQLGQLHLLDRVIKESLRLLPPDALMVRAHHDAADGIERHAIARAMRGDPLPPARPPRR